MSTALEGGEGSASRTGRSLPPGKTRYPLYRRVGGTQSQSGQVRKISPPTGIRSPDCPARSRSLYRMSYRAHLFLVYFVNFINNLYMFQTFQCSSWGGTTVFMWHLVLVILYGWLSGMQGGMKLHTRQPALQNNNYQVSHKYSCSSWWWTWRVQNM
jgi:hypothetical protein